MVTHQGKEKLWIQTGCILFKDWLSVTPCLWCWVHTYIHTYLHAYIHTYIHTYVFEQHFFINTYFIEQYRYVLYVYFCICPFQLPNWFYDVWWELVDETPIINCYRSTFCPILGHHQGCVYCKRDETFACTLLLYKCLLFILACFCCILFVSISSCSS